jgi:hypothetical protein
MAVHQPELLTSPGGRNDETSKPMVGTIQMRQIATIAR